MPIYEYHCSGCGTSYEARRSITQVAEAYVCPQCEVEAPRTISLFNAVRGSDGVALGSDMGFACDAQGMACGAGGTCACQ